MKSMDRFLFFLVVFGLFTSGLAAHSDGRVKSDYEQMAFCTEYVAGLAEHYKTGNEYNQYRENDTYHQFIKWNQPIEKSDPVVVTLAELGNEKHLKDLLELDQRLKNLNSFVTPDDPNRVLCKRDPLRSGCLLEENPLDVEPLRKACDLARAKNPSPEIVKRRDSERAARRDVPDMVKGRMEVVRQQVGIIEGKRSKIELVPGGAKCLESMRARVSSLFAKAEAVEKSASAALDSCDGTKAPTALQTTPSADR